MFFALNETCTVSPMRGVISRVTGWNFQGKPLTLASKVTRMVRSRMVSEACSTRLTVPL